MTVLRLDEHADETAVPRASGVTFVLAGRLLLSMALLVVWEIGARRLGPLFLAAPSDVAVRLFELFRSGAIFLDLWVTISISMTGFALGCIGGVILPLLLNRSPRLTEALEPFITAAMGIPKFALAPLLILWFGIGAKPKLVIVSLMVFFAIFVTVFSGIRNVDRRLTDMARILGASPAMIARRIVWPSLLPFFFAGLKIAMPRAVSAALVGEFLVGSEGIGHSIEQARQISDMTGVFAGITVATALVVIINVFVEVLQNRALAWRRIAHDMAG